MTYLIKDNEFFESRLVSDFICDAYIPCFAMFIDESLNLLRGEFGGIIRNYLRHFNMGIINEIESLMGPACFYNIFDLTFKREIFNQSSEDRVVVSSKFSYQRTDYGKSNGQLHVNDCTVSKILKSAGILDYNNFYFQFNSDCPKSPDTYSSDCVNLFTNQHFYLFVKALSKNKILWNNKTLIKNNIIPVIFTVNQTEVTIRLYFFVLRKMFSSNGW